MSIFDKLGSPPQVLPRVHVGLYVSIIMGDGNYISLCVLFISNLGNNNICTRLHHRSTLLVDGRTLSTVYKQEAVDDSSSVDGQLLQTYIHVHTYIYRRRAIFTAGGGGARPKLMFVNFKDVSAVQWRSL